MLKIHVSSAHYFIRSLGQEDESNKSKPLEPEDKKQTFFFPDQLVIGLENPVNSKKLNIVTKM